MDGTVLKELKIRMRIESIFNKVLEDFETKEEYDQYLEDREDMIYNLEEGTNVDEIEKRISDYTRDNQDTILRNQARKMDNRKQRASTAGRAPGTATESDLAADKQQRQQQQQTDGEHLGTAAAAVAAAAASVAAATEYNAQMPGMQGMVYGSAPMPMGAAPTGAGAGDLPPDAAAGTWPPSDKNQWLRMAVASGWTQDLPKQRAMYEAFSQVFVC